MTKKHKVRSETQQRPVSTVFNDEKILERIIAWRWFPFALFGFLSLLYFIRLFQGNLTFFQSEGGILAYNRFGWGTSYKSPFNEDALWHNTSLGGLPGAQGLVAYTQFIINNLLVTVVPEYIAFGIYYVLLVFASGLGMFFFLNRGMGMHRMTSLIIGVAYMFAPVDLSLTYAGHLSKMGVYVILPFQFWCTEKGMETGRFRYFLFLGGLIALSIGTAHLQYAYLAMWGIALFGLFKFVQLLTRRVHWKQAVVRGMYLSFAAIIALGIAARAFAPQYLNTVTVSKRAIASEDKTAGKSFAASWSLHPEEIASLILPEFAGYDLGKEGQHYWGRNSFKINSEYFGVLIVLFAIGSIFFFRKNGYVKFFTFLFLFSLLYSLGDHTPLFTLGYYLIPGMKFVRGLAFLSLLFSFAAMFMAAFGLDQFFNPEMRKNIQWKTWFRIAGVFLIAGLLFTVLTGPLLGVWKAIFYSGLQGQKAQAMVANQNEIKVGGLILMLMAGGVYGLFYAYRSGKITPAIFGMGLIAIIIADTWRIDKQFLEWIPINRAASPAEMKLPPFEILKENDKSLYRILPIGLNGRFTYPGVNLVTGFNDFTMLEYNNVLNQLNLPLLNLLSCKYIISKGKQNFPGLPQVYAQDDWYIYRNPAAYPYVYFARGWEVIKEKDRILKLLASGAQDFSRTPIIENDPPEGFVSSQSAPNDTATGTVEFLNQGEYYEGKLSEDIFRVNQPAQGILVISENYHPDWHAYVDGKESPVSEINYLWRGVFVPAGEHKVEFIFKPRIIAATREVSFLFMIGYVIALGGIFLIPLLRRQ